MGALAISPEKTAVQIAALVGVENTSLLNGRAVASPANVEELRSVLRFCSEQDLVIVPTGGGTKLTWGNPVRSDVTLDLRRMDQVREHAWQDMTCSVDAGCAWAKLQVELSRHGQMVALDPLHPESATVGGIVATNDSGVLRLKYGGLRDLIIGMTVVLADGTVAKTGGKVVKNVAGYDLHKLMTGSFGTLGVITSVNFRLHPVESHRRTWTAHAKDPVELRDALASLLDSQLAPSSVQVRMAHEGCAMDVCISVPNECDAANEASLRKIFGSLSVSSGRDEAWQARQALFGNQGALILKLSCHPTEICKLLAEIQENATSEGIDVSAVAQATGLATVSLEGAAEKTMKLFDRLRNRVSEAGGAAVVLETPAALHGRLDRWGKEPNAIGLMRAVKARFDPKRILSPGRFVGGI